MMKGWQTKFWALLLLPLLLAAGCAADDTPKLDADLVVEQYITENNDLTGLVYVTCVMHWTEGELATMRFTQQFATAEQASIGYQGRVSELGASGQVMLDGDTLSYYISTEPWEGKTYAEMYKAMSEDDDWQVVEERSGEYEPTEN